MKSIRVLRQECG